MVIYNTMSRKKELLEPAGEELKVYLCGPTVYNYIHIGNARTVAVFDVFRRYLRYRGMPVRFVSNFTDIDDRLIGASLAEGVSVEEIAKKYIGEFLTDIKGLYVLPADANPRATESIGIILDLIGALVEKGYAYRADSGDVYFRARRFEGYGRLSHQNVDELEEGVRVEPGEGKEDPLDFALWKAAKPGEPKWDSPYGEGRPGWHIECSAMAKRHLGDTVDIHCGGLDLVFPHHENEIAQSECGNGAVFSRYWMHVGMVNVDSRKMSKSLGNFFTVREISAEYGYEPIRFFLINAHYRSQINFSRGNMDACAAALERLRSCRASLARAIESADEAKTGIALAEKARERCVQFIAAMEDDLNTADAIAAIFELVRDINSAGEESPESLRYAAATFDDLCGVLGILHEKEEAIPEEILLLSEERQTARQARDFVRADALRDEIASRGYLLEDTAAGPVVRKK